MAKRSRAAVRAAAQAATLELSRAKRGTHLGDLLWWDFAPGWREQAGMVRDAWRAAGLDPDADLPPPPDRACAFGRAIEATRGALRADDCRAEDCAPTSTGDRRVAVVKLRRNGSVTGDTVGTIVLPKNGAPYVEKTDPYNHGDKIVQVAQQTYEGRYTTDDMRAGVVAILDRWAATPCRACPPHIVYWLPSPGSETIRRVRDALARVNAGAIHLSPMHDDVDSREAATSAANQGLESQLSAFVQQVDAWKAAPPARTSTIENRIAEAEKLRTTGALYRDILGAAVAEVDSRIDAVQKAMRETLGIVEAKKGETARA